MPRSRSRSQPQSPSPVLRRRYALEGTIGAGGQGQVYRAWDAHQGQLVAIKRSQNRAGLLQEAELLTRLHHPCIPEYVEWFEHQGWCYLVEGYQPGIPMHWQKFYTLAEIVWIGQQLCEVLTYVHGRGIIHRDIKPENVLLDAPSSVSLIDFGLSQSVFDPAAFADPAGTQAYAAPEQWTDGVVHPAADVYSLGMLLGCALTNRQPEAVLQTRTFTGLWADTVPGELEAFLCLLDRMIALQPEQRPELSALAHFLATVL